MLKEKDGIWFARSNQMGFDGLCFKFGFQQEESET